MHYECQLRMVVEEDSGGGEGLIGRLRGCLVRCCERLGKQEENSPMSGDGGVEGGGDGEEKRRGVWRVEEVAGRVDKASAGYPLYVCLLTTLNTLINLSHDNRLCSFTSCFSHLPFFTDLIFNNQ